MFQQINETTIINLEKVDAIENIGDYIVVYINGRGYESDLNEHELLELIETKKKEKLLEISQNTVWQTTSASDFAG